MITVVNGSKVRLREKRLSDARDDYTWHSDPELAHLDGGSPTALTFERYLSDYKREMRYFSTPKRQVFAIETLDGKHIGNCAYYNIDALSGEAEMGIMIGERGYWSQGYGTDAIAALLTHIFEETDLKRIYLKTLESNKRAQSCFKKCGFKLYMSLVTNRENFLFMELYRKNWKKKQAEGQALHLNGD